MPAIAIQPDFVRHSNGEEQSYSARWAQVMPDLGIEPVMVDVTKPDALDTITQCNAFMWRFKSSNPERGLAQRFLSVLERTSSIPVFPSLETRWHIDDKIAQAYAFSRLGIPHPKTWIFYSRETTQEFIRSATYPFVLKLSSGRQSRNVVLVPDRAVASEYADLLFGPGVYSLNRPQTSLSHEFLRRGRRMLAATRGVNVDAAEPGSDLHQGYFLAQEFIAGNEFDTRIVVAGKRAYGLRRFNRENDFRASGSGLIDLDPGEIGTDIVKMSFDISAALHAQTLALDIVRNRDGTPLVIELALSYPSWAVNKCPGSWFCSNPQNANEPMVWHEGPTRVEDSILEQFLHDALLIDPCRTRLKR